MLIHHFLENSADSYPEKTAIIHKDKRFTYLEIEKKANALANWLLDAGLNRGDRVAILLRNSVEYIYAYYGALKAGAVVVPMNTGVGSKDLGRMFDNCTPRFLISECRFLPIIGELIEIGACNFHWIALAGLEPDYIFPENLPVVSYRSIFKNHPDTRPDIILIDKDFSSVIYTSGSTGLPKGVTLTHLNLVTNTRSILRYLKLTSKDRVMAVLPFYYVYGKTLLNTHFAASGSVIIDNRFAFPNAVLKKMIEEKATGFSGVPSTFSILLNHSAIGKMNFPTLRYMTQAGGNMPPDVKKCLIDVFPDKQIFIMYGATEASARLSYLEPDQLETHMASIGKAIPNVELSILDEQGKALETGEEGEIVARGTNIMQGYWNAPEETAAVLKNGWYYTGDFGKKDEEGFFYITGRKKDMIKTGKYKVSAREIEDVLYEYPHVLEAAVVGVPDSIFGETVKAFVVPKGDIDEKYEVDKIRGFCRTKLELYKVPRKIEFIRNMPKNESGKILKQQLKSKE